VQLATNPGTVESWFFLERKNWGAGTVFGGKEKTKDKKQKTKKKVNLLFFRNPRYFIWNLFYLGYLVFFLWGKLWLIDLSPQ